MVVSIVISWVSVTVRLMLKGESAVPVSMEHIIYHQVILMVAKVNLCVCVCIIVGGYYCIHSLSILFMSF